MSLQGDGEASRTRGPPRRSPRFVAWVLAVLTAALVVRGLLLEPIRVGSSSMAPALWPGELALVWTGPRGELAVGDVVAWAEASGGAPDFARVVALPGETVHITDGRMRSIGGVSPAATEPPPRPSCLPRDMALRLEQVGPRATWVGQGEGDLRIEVPAKTVFLLGDSRDTGGDSRVWGPVPVHNIQGVVWRVAWGPARCEAESLWTRLFRSPL